MHKKVIINLCNGHTMYKDVLCDNYNIKGGQSCVKAEIFYTIEAKLVFKLDCYRFKMLMLIPINKKNTEM